MGLIVGCTFLGGLLAWLYLNTRSPWVAALAQGAVNASPRLAFFFLKPGFAAALGGLILGLAGWIPMGVFLGWLVWSKRLPVQLEPAISPD